MNRTEAIAWLKKNGLIWPDVISPGAPIAPPGWEWVRAKSPDGNSVFTEVMLRSDSQPEAITEADWKFTEMTNIEKRLQNTERALVALWALIGETMPHHVIGGASQMMEEYFEAQGALGSEMPTSNGNDPFIKE